jgi:hypothetical protein
MGEQLPGQDRDRKQDDRADGNMPARKVEVGHSSSVARQVARVGDDFGSKCRHTWFVFALLLTATVALSSGGLHGTVVIDPARPVCAVGQPCSAPDRYDVLAFWRSGRRIAQTKTDAKGSYRVTLPAGIYAVTAPRHKGIGRGLRPSRVTVLRGRYARANFSLDIGIR